MRTRLTIPEAEVKYAKSLGAQFDKDKQEFYVEDVEDLVPFLRWIDARLKEPCKPVFCVE